MSDSDSRFIIVRGQRYTMEWGDTGAQWRIGRVPRCPDCFDQIEGPRERSVPIGVDTRSHGAFVECDCGARFALQEE